MNYTGNRLTDIISQMAKQDDKKHEFIAIVMTILPFLQQRDCQFLLYKNPHLNQTSSPNSRSWISAGSARKSVGNYS